MNAKDLRKAVKLGFITMGELGKALNNLKTEKVIGKLNNSLKLSFLESGKKHFHRGV